ncbi:MAG: SEC-C domain-containing protein [Planctomycetes bacterium]|nr:SEC-C domain-containing protein [Planctomycetota bacterium]
MASQRQEPRRGKGKRAGPDDIIEIGGVTIARHGRLISMQSHRTPEQQRQFESYWVEMYPRVVQEINDRVARIRQVVASHDPLELLRHGFWAMSAAMIGKTSEADYDFADGVAARMVEYVQAVIVSTPPVGPREELTEEKWKTLYEEVKQLYESLCLTFHLVNSAKRKASEPDYDLDYDYFCVQAQVHVTFVRAFRYAVHDLAFLIDFLGPHDEALRRLFGITAGEFVEAMNRIHRSMSRDSVAAFAELHNEHQRALGLAQEISGDYPRGMDIVAATSRLKEEPGWQERMGAIVGRIMGLDLFDLERITTLPTALLDELSLEPGQDGTFFAPGDYAGWPLRVLPTKFRPFLKVDGKHYCFDPINIMDDIYRAIQRLLCRRDPAYADTWNDRQKEASERRPIELLQDLLPQAKVFRPVMYPWKTGAGEQQPGWCELDGLVLFDDTMFVVEVKAGAFTWAPPLTDFPSYMRSLKDLLKRPAEQAARFLAYLRHAETVTLYDGKHRAVAAISKNDFRNIIPLCLTLDALTTAAHRVRDLAPVGIAVPEPVCCMSIDDIRVYRDVFTSAVTFVHFMHKRYEAERDPYVNVDDELDHLGLYLEYVNYVRHARILRRDLGTAVGSWAGYRRVIDRFFFQMAIEPDGLEKPRPRIGPKLSELIACLDREGSAGRCHCAAILLDIGRESRDDFEKELDKALRRSLERAQPSPFHIQGESSVTVFCDAPGIRALLPTDMREYTLAWMMRANLDRSLLLCVRFDVQQRVASVSWELLRLEDVPPEQRGRIEAESHAQAERRVQEHVRQHGRIGRNEPCPCGSGRKFKRCCGRGQQKGKMR